jgi:N-acetylglucosamine-6-phosphate deacetylase
MIIKNANVYNENNTFKIRDIHMTEDRITDTSPNGDTIIDATGLYAIPGLTDIHFHGCAGVDFCDGTPKALETIAKYEAANGITTICPATMSLPEEMLSAILKNAADYHQEDGSTLCGINLEGPFLSVKKKGAQNEEYIRKPDLDMFFRLDELSGNMIKLVDVAPEEEGAKDFVVKLKGKKVISLAHTTADYNTAKEAFDLGASHVTHLYNAMPPLHHRDPGVIGAALDTPHCNVELICDSIHIHPSVVRATIKMFGEDRIVFISDSMMATGLPDGEYSLGGQEVKVVGKKAVLKNDEGAIAGSVTNLFDCMKNAVLNMGIPFETAVKASAVNPAKIIGIYEDYGSISCGKIANIVLLDDAFHIKYVIINGKVINKR